MEGRDNIKFCGLTNTGKRRNNNEDAFVAELLDDNTLLAIVIDGVGGYEGGEVAAAIAQKEIPAYLKEFNRGERLELLKQAVVCANNAIYDRRQFDKARPNMGCVLTSVLVDTGRNVIDMVHVGDTRLYQYYVGKLIKLSHDHSYVGYCEEIGDLTEDEAMHHPRRNEISRSVGEGRRGVGDQGFLEAVEFPLLPNSTFLLCSDGLTDMITSEQIVEILNQNHPIEEKAQALINAANEAGGKDNITVVLVEYQSEEETETDLRVEDSAEVTEEINNDVLLAEEEEKKRQFLKIVLLILLATSVLLLGACIVSCMVSLKKNNQVKELEKKEQEFEQQEVQSMQNDTVNIDSVSNPSFSCDTISY